MLLLTRTFLIILFLFLYQSFAVASPWISVGDTRLKQNLHLLADTGAISIQLTTWPIMWSDVQTAINLADESKLNMSQRLALNELKFEMRFQTKNELKRTIELAGSSSSSIFRNFSGQELEKARISNVFDIDSESLSLRLQANLAIESGDESLHSQLYGSYIAGVLGNWVIGVGAIDRWWGASSNSSLILGNNAYPVPGVFFRTKGTQQFESPLLSWLGSWQFVSFVGQLESGRHIPEAKLTGMRFTFKPFERLEIGLSRAMQWGGEGRSESLSTFFKSLTSQGENSSEQSGNQLAGYDLRLNFLKTNTYGVSFYSQLIGEDEAGYLPSKFVSQAGLDYSHVVGEEGQLNAFIELINTTAGSIGGKQFNTTYSHSLYQSGYRYRGRVMGASFDNDAKVISVGASYQVFEASQRVSGSFSQVKLNTDGVLGGNGVSSVALDLYTAEFSYQRLLFDGLFNITTSYLTDVPDLKKDEYDKFSVSFKWTYRL